MGALTSLNPTLIDVAKRTDPHDFPRGQPADRPPHDHS